MIHVNLVVHTSLNRSRFAGSSPSAAAPIARRERDRTYSGVSLPAGSSVSLRCFLIRSLNLINRDFADEHLFERVNVFQPICDFLVERPRRQAYVCQYGTSGFAKHFVGKFSWVGALVSGRAWTGALSSWCKRLKPSRPPFAAPIVRPNDRPFLVEGWEAAA
jgi:hypothetical protein